MAWFSVGKGLLDVTPTYFTSAISLLLDVLFCKSLVQKLFDGIKLDSHTQSQTPLYTHSYSQQTTPQTTIPTQLYDVGSSR